jgi:glucose-6-phosphate 1-dehydrogenase
MKKASSHTLVIFGASGDLTRKKLMPALFELHLQDLLPQRFAILGVGRTAYGDETFRDLQSMHLRKACPDTADEAFASFLPKLSYLSIDTEDTADYSFLKDTLGRIDRSAGTGGNYIYYLATPPRMYGIISSNLAGVGLTRPEGESWRRIIVEKPFGSDLESATELNKRLHEHFDEEQIYRIDHYLGKETVQNILVTRFSNVIFEPLWNRNYISHVEISSFEDFGVEGRGGYYDNSGALRDMVQNHLMQLVGLTAMECPAQVDAWSIRNETLKVFQSLRPVDELSIDEALVRAQYTGIPGKHPGYTEEAGVSPVSTTETFIALKFFIDNWRWAGVPFFIRTGKCMPTKVTEIVIHFRPAPHSLFPGSEHIPGAANQLIMRIQPDEGLLVKFGMKLPGGGFNVKNVTMDFHYSDLKDVQLASAYARLLLDCMVGDPTLYTRDDAIAATWAFVEPILSYWKNTPQAPLYYYPTGSWGPEEADGLVNSMGLSWRYPCRNLASNGEMCEL